LEYNPFKIEIIHPIAGVWSIIPLKERFHPIAGVWSIIP